MVDGGRLKVEGLNYFYMNKTIFILYYYFIILILKCQTVIWIQIL
jgi:hypothetical protein